MRETWVLSLLLLVHSLLFSVGKEIRIVSFFLIKRDETELHCFKAPSKPRIGKT